MRIAEKLKNFAANRRAMRQLDQLDDRALQDLGLSRSTIRAAVLGTTR